jgi:hypothetical protein
MTFASDVAFFVNVGAELVADGTSDDPITMTATNGDEQQGWWKGVAIYSSNANNTMNYVEVRHAGSDPVDFVSEAANVAVDEDAALNLTNSIIGNGGGYGVYLDGANASLESFSNNLIGANAKAPVLIPFSNVGVVDAGSIFEDGSTVAVYGTFLEGTATMTVIDTPYRFISSPSVGDGSSLTIEPGVEMTFASDVAFFVNVGAELVADGTSDDPITMTATDGNGQQGWWKGVAIYSSNANNTMNYVKVRHAGSNPVDFVSEAANVSLDSGAELTFENSTITDSGQHGVYCDASDVLLSAFSNNYSNNAGQDVKGCP